MFQDEGIDVLLGTQVLALDGLSGEHVSLQLQSGNGTRTVEGTDILVAVGRTPNTSGIGLEKAGIEVTEKGHIRVNDRLETTAPNVWAMGECAGSPYFTHVSEDDAAIILENLNGGHRSTRGPAGSVLRLHRSGAGACWPQRVTGAGKRYCLPGCIRAFRRRLAGLDHFGETRVHEDANRRTQ